MTGLVIGRDFGPTRQLRAALGADRLLAVPELGEAGGTWRDGWLPTLERWEQRSEDLGDFSSVVIACWDEIDTPSPFVDVDGTAWSSQLEQRLTTWAVATKVGIARCADGGAVVVVVERPAAFDAVGRSMLVGVAEGVLGLMPRRGGFRGPSRRPGQRGHDRAVDGTRGAARSDAGAGVVPGPGRCRGGGRHPAAPVGGRGRRHRLGDLVGRRASGMTPGRTVLISGASGGVGRGIAVACGEAGWTVWVAERVGKPRVRPWQPRSTGPAVGVGS